MIWAHSAQRFSVSPTNIASFNILPEHYPIVGKHLLEAVAHVLGDAATDEIVEAWTEAYGVLANIFIEVEEGIYRESETAKGGWRGTRDFRIAEKTTGK